MTSLTAAERQRRYRFHKAGNHALCDPERDCGQAVTDVTPDVTSRDPVPPVGLRSGGRRLWHAMATTGRPAEQLALVAEAARIVDRLDRLDEFLRGDVESWAHVRIDNDTERAIVVIDKAMSEARQQALALARIVTDLRTAAGGKQQPEQGGTSSVLDQLAARRREREEAARLADTPGR